MAIPYSRSLDPVIINRLDAISEMLTCLVNELRHLPRDVYGPDFSRHMGARHDMSRKKDLDNHKVHSGPIKRSRVPREALSEKPFSRARVDNGTMYVSGEGQRDMQNKLKHSRTLIFFLVRIKLFRVHTPKNVMVTGCILLTEFDACQRVFALIGCVSLALAFANHQIAWSLERSNSVHLMIILI